MSDSPSGSKARVLGLFFAFTVLFIVVFSLGVFVGKQYGREELRVTKRFEEPVPTIAPTPPEEIKEDLKIEDVIADIEAESDEPDQKDETAAGSLPDASAEPEAKTAEVKPEQPVETAPPATPVPRETLAKITEEIERELKKASTPQESVPAKATLPPVDPQGLYTVQIGSFQDRGQANKLASSLKSRGYPVFIKSMITSDNTNWYRVRVGTFSDLETATAYGESLKILEPEVNLVFITVNN